MSCIVYVDGFNLYYGCLRDSPHKWLNLELYANTALPNEDVVKIRYFTARVSGKVDSGAPVRQDAYLRALKTLPLVDIHYGKFLSHAVRMPLAQPPAKGPKTVEVIKTEEKGSDVNLASYLLWDAFSKQCDTQVVISNDSDFCETLRIARIELGMRIGIINPHGSRQPNRSLQRQSDFDQNVKAADLLISQFPNPLPLAVGNPIPKPLTWK